MLWYLTKQLKQSEEDGIDITLKGDSSRLKKKMEQYYLKYQIKKNSLLL